jgi:hypothetical protein
MLRTLTILTLTLGLSLTLVACKKKGGDDGDDSCAKLLKKVCEGKGSDYCKKAKDVLENDIMTDFDMKPLSKDERAAGCVAILSDEKIVPKWIEGARRKIDAKK